MDNFLPRRDEKSNNAPKIAKNSAAGSNNINPREPEASEVPKAHLRPPKPKKTFKEWLRSLTKKQWIIIGVALTVLLVSGGFGLYTLLKKDEKPVSGQQKQEVTPEPEPTTVASNLTGLQVDKSVNERPVTAIMIENSLEARPQSGLDQAGVVFEAITEGGITRLIALYQDTEPDYIGPVRSLRPYYLQWAMGFDAAVAHAGGSPEALSAVGQWGAKDLNHNSSYFWRIKERVQPHNLYTSIAKLREYENQKGFGKANYTPLARNEKESPAATPTARTIDLNISSANYNVHYDYDRDTNSYKRSVGGKAHTDQRTNAQLSPDVVVALIIPQGKNGVYYTYATLGSGQVVVFQDGKVIEGTWKKDSNTANFVFTDPSGKELKLNPGQTWFTALGERSRVTFNP